MLNRENIIQYAEENYGTKMEYPWSSTPENGILRCSANRKWYAAILQVARNKVCLEGEDVIDVLNIKCEPEMVYSLREQKGFAPAYHMNKKHWLTIVLDGTVKDETIYQLLDLSYELVK